MADSNVSMPAAVFADEIFAAADPFMAAIRATTPTVLARLARHRDATIRAIVAENLATDQETLTELAGSTRSNISHAAAHNPHTPAATVEMVFGPMAPAVLASTPGDVLAGLAKSLHTQTRSFVAANPSTPPETLTMLAADRRYEVRAAVASNPSTLPEALMDLCDDDIVDYHVFENPSTPADVLTAFSGVSHHRTAILANPATPVEVLEEGSRSESWFDREAVASNPSTPLAILLAFETSDEEADVRYLALTNPSVPETLRLERAHELASRSLIELLGSPLLALVLADRYPDGVDASFADAVIGLAPAWSGSLDTLLEVPASVDA